MISVPSPKPHRSLISRLVLWFPVVLIVLLSAGVVAVWALTKEEDRAIHDEER